MFLVAFASKLVALIVVLVQWNLEVDLSLNLKLVLFLQSTLPELFCVDVNFVLPGLGSVLVDVDHVISITSFVCNDGVHPSGLLEAFEGMN